MNHQFYPSKGIRGTSLRSVIHYNHLLPQSILNEYSRVHRIKVSSNLFNHIARLSPYVILRSIQITLNYLIGISICIENTRFLRVSVDQMPVNGHILSIWMLNKVYACKEHIEFYLIFH